MSLAHPGQLLASQAVELLVRGKLDHSITLREAGVVRLKGITGTERVYQVVHSSIAERFPALRSQERTPTNLPESTTRFIGRSKERSMAKSLLRKHRLLTLTGMGGIGKTRLALEVARDLIERYPDGVWWVELAPVASSEGVAQAVASVLRLREARDVPLIEQLVGHLAGRSCLLILDNCEHLLQASAKLAHSLLSATTGVKILATSREPLHVTGESAMAVPPLTTPPQREAFGALSKSAAVRLFADHARAARRSFRLT